MLDVYIDGKERFAGQERGGVGVATGPGEKSANAKHPTIRCTQEKERVRDGGREGEGCQTDKKGETEREDSPC